jgi:hypothetical protein
MATALPPVAGTAKPFSLSSKVTVGHLDSYSEAQLLDLRAQIDERLGLSLQNVNMERELVAQLRVIKKVQTEVLEEGETPANQVAQVANSVAATLTSLAKLQIDIYDSERLKKIERILIEQLKLLPTAAQNEFLTAYQTELEAV